MENVIQKISDYEAIFWDWNGTLVDDILMCLESVSVSLEKRGLKKPSIDEYRKIFRFPVVDYYKDLGFNFDVDDFETLAEEYTNEYDKRKFIAKLFPEVKEVLAVISSKKIPQYILSASEKNILVESLDHFGISKYFKGVGGCDNTLAGGKVEIGKNLLKEQNICGKFLMIGDTDHDAEVAKEIGADCVLVLGGHCSEERLRACNPLALIKSRYELYPIIFPNLFKYSEGKKPEILDANTSRYVENYRVFYDDIKMTHRVEDW